VPSGVRVRVSPSPQLFMLSLNLQVQMTEKLLIPQEDSDQRIDKFLADKNSGTPRRFFQQEIKNGTILINNKQVAPSYKLKIQDELYFTENFFPFKKQEANLTPDKKIKFKIIFQNKDFAIIEKPAGISVHPSLKEPSGTLVNGLLEKFPNIKNVGEDPTRPGIVHRLDKFTSGLLIVALNQKSFEFFKENFKTRKIKKEYLAICWGRFKQKNGFVDDLIGKSKSNPTKQASSKNHSRLINPKQAHTEYSVLKENDETSLVLLKPSTGRKHQIRVHMHSIGHPLVGDFLYENKLIKEKNKKFSRFMLHASKISFIDQKGGSQAFSSTPPREFKNI
jgi:23S rRNA pseudouridine1911/1915/1917 synthase